jgi:hypothetical protein
MKPPLWFTTPSTVASPRPVPRPASLVVKNGSNTRSQGGLVHAGALVAHRHAHVRPGLGLEGGAAAPRDHVFVARGDGEGPPLGMASRPLTTRFMTT